jgi:hypothetical protein
LPEAQSIVESFGSFPKLNIFICPEADPAFVLGPPAVEKGSNVLF